MANTLVNAATFPGLPLATFHTVPALTTAVVISAVYAQETGAGSAVASLAVLRNGDSSPTSLVSSLSVTQATSVNMLPAKITLEAGDRLQAQNTAALPFSRVASSGSPLATATFSVLLCNTAGTTLVGVVESSGHIYTSTDSGATWTLTRVPSPAVSHNTGVYFGGYFYLYTSAILYIRSADGITWSSPAAATLAPFNVGLSKTMSAKAAIIEVTGTLYYTSGNQVYSSTDAITWTTFGVALPVTPCCGIVWTGTRFLTASGTGATGNIYWSTNGAAWTTVTTGTGAIASGYTPLASDGAGGVMLAAASGATAISLDHGTTWAPPGVTAHATYSGTAWVGDCFLTPTASDGQQTRIVLGAVINKTYSNGNGYAGTGGNGSLYPRFAQCASKVYLTVQGGSGGLFASSDLTLTPRGGCGGLTISMMEVT